jgi:hypothetical protein
MSLTIHILWMLEVTLPATLASSGRRDSARRPPPARATAVKPPSSRSQPSQLAAAKKILHLEMTADLTLVPVIRIQT